MKNVEKADRIHLGSLITEIRDGRYEIPNFQREFEWQPWDVTELIKSIFLDYYIGTLLLWKGSKKNFQLLSCETLYGFEYERKPEHIVLDGQQRLTAMYYAFFAPEKEFPKRKNRIYYFLRLNNFSEGEYEDAFFYYSATKYYQELANNAELQYENHIFPLKIIGSGERKLIRWIDGYKDYWKQRIEKINEKDELNKVEKNQKTNFEQYIKYAEKFDNDTEELLNKYFISYIELDKDIKIGKVCEIFTKINNTGIKLDIFDLLNALLVPKDIFLKDLWRETSKEIDFTETNKMKIYVLQVMSILHQNYCSPRYLYNLVPGATKTIKLEDNTRKDIVLIPTKEEFILEWNNAKEAIIKTIKRLKDPREFGVISDIFLPYPSLIPILSAILNYVEKADYKNKIAIDKKIKKWYWASIFMKEYSSSVETKSARDFMLLKKWFKDENQKPEVVKSFEQELENIDLANEIKKGSAIYNAIFNILIIKGAKDWQTFNYPDYSDVDDYHIVPYHWGKDNIGREINSVLNRTPLTSGTSQNIIGAKMPNEYIKDLFENNKTDDVYELFQTHLISSKALEILQRENFTKNDYFEFVRERKKAIIEEIKNIFDPKTVIPENFKQLDDKIEQIEISLRNKINDKLSDISKPYKTFVNSKIKEKIEYRIQSVLKKDPTLTKEQFYGFREKLDFFDLQEYNVLIQQGNVWGKFESNFKNKNELNLRFAQLGSLRNSIRHSRAIGDIILKDGHAAITWFETVLKIEE